MTPQQLLTILEPIPWSKWTSNRFLGDEPGTGCVWYHLYAHGGVAFRDEANMLCHDLIGCSLSYINDKNHPDYQQKRVKDRVIAACKDMIERLNNAKTSI